MLEQEIRNILKPFEEDYEIIYCRACENYLKDGFEAELKARKVIRTTNTSRKYGSAEIRIEPPFVYIDKGFGEDIINALKAIR